MNANKLFTEFSVKKIWDKLLQHDKAMNSTLLILSSGNWTEQEDGTFKNTVLYSTFKDTDKLTVDLYDDGTLSDTLLTEYEQYIDSFEIINGALVAIANIKPTQTFTLVIKGEFEVNKVEITTIECVNDFTSTETNVPASGNLARLLNDRIDDCFQSVSDGKALVASAITDKGVTTASDATFETMANNITNIKTEVNSSYLIGKSINVSASTHYFSVRGINTLNIGDNYGNPLYVYGVTEEGVETYLGYCQYKGSGQKNTFDVSAYAYVRCYGSGSPCGHTIRFVN